MAKIKVILFSESDKPRILINPANLEELKENPLAIINPDLSKVKGIPSQYWRLEGDEIIAAEIKDRAKIDFEIHSKKSVKNIVIENEKVKNDVAIYASLVSASVVVSYYVSKYELIDKLIKEIVNVYQSI